MADVPDLESGGKPWGFESLHQHHGELYEAKSATHSNKKAKWAAHTDLGVPYIRTWL